VTNKFRRFHRNQCTLYAQCWCESCKHDGVEYCTVSDDHKVGVCTVCGERGSNAHRHVYVIDSDALQTRLREEFEVDFLQLAPVSMEGQWRWLTGELTLDGTPTFCVGQARVNDLNDYGPRTLYTRAIKDGADRLGLLPPNPPKEPDQPLQPLVGAALSAATPQKPASPDGQHFSTVAVVAANRNSLTPSIIKNWATDHYGDAKGLGRMMGPMLLTLTMRVHGAGYATTDIDHVADLIFENQPPPKDEEE